MTISTDPVDVCHPFLGIVCAQSARCKALQKFIRGQPIKEESSIQQCPLYVPWVARVRLTSFLSNSGS